MNMLKRLGLAGLLLGMLGLITGCYNPSTPAGFEGYVTRGAIVGKRAFVAGQQGPTSTGLGWLLEVKNVDFRWRTYNEGFKVMSSDNLALIFKAHLVIRPKPGQIKGVIETYGGEEWYPRSIQEPFRNAIYESVSGYKALDAKDKRDVIAENAKKLFDEFLKDKPFELEKVVVGTIDLPEQVARSQEMKISKETEIEAQSFEIEIAEKKRDIRIIEAKGIAEAQRIITKTLTPLYLQHEAIEAQRAMASSPNHTTVYIPSGENGVPIIRAISD
jgi:regulator of protease activity HflC (stomatin/prohibitin superfamily)